MNRRKMLGTTTALLGGAFAGVAGDAFGQETGKPAAAAPAAAPAAGPNLNPPVVQIKGGTLRGLREGKTSSFLGIRYAEAERFGPPKPVQPWDGHQERPGLGPGLPESGADHGQRRRARVPASLLDRERALPVSERLDPEPHAGGEEARHGLDARRRFHERLLDGVVRVRRPHASASSATSWSSA